MKLEKKLVSDILQWDVESWSPALPYWTNAINWQQVETCLELGAREGGLSLWLALKGKKVICSDLKDIRTTAEKLHKKYNVHSLVQYQDIDATNIPYNNHFDLIIFKSIIGGIGRKNGMETQKEVFEEIHKALKPGGQLLFAENLVASPLHQLFRKLFNKWGYYWRYISIQETKELLQNFSSLQCKATGVLSAFGRTENQRSMLAKIDRVIFNSVFFDKWKYIIYGIAEK